MHVSTYQTYITFMLALLFQKEECDQTQRWLFYKEILKSLLLLRFPLLFFYCSQSAVVIILNWGVRDSSPGWAYSVSLWCTGTYILLLLLLITVATINSFKCCIRFYSLIFPFSKEKSKQGEDKTGNKKVARIITPL